MHYQYPLFVPCYLGYPNVQQSYHGIPNVQQSSHGYSNVQHSFQGDPIKEATASQIEAGKFVTASVEGIAELSNPTRIFIADVTPDNFVRIVYPTGTGTYNCGINATRVIMDRIEIEID
ncbi:hypothetical protein AAHT65_07585 [Bacillus atrophaeus]|uniref:hypothetical protein n=1 Tax=Bacillus atrophaeus TaxID=1452 RepID=UPI0031B9B077